eukprot:g4318.t1
MEAAAGGGDGGRGGGGGGDDNETYCKDLISFNELLVLVLVDFHCAFFAAEATVDRVPAMMQATLKRLSSRAVPAAAGSGSELWAWYESQSQRHARLLKGGARSKRALHKHWPALARAAVRDFGKSLLAASHPDEDGGGNGSSSSPFSSSLQAAGGGVSPSRSSFGDAVDAASLRERLQSAPATLGALGAAADAAAEADAAAAASAAAAGSATIFTGTYNVNGKVPKRSNDLKAWFVPRAAAAAAAAAAPAAAGAPGGGATEQRGAEPELEPMADIYAIGLQEMVPLNLKNVGGPGVEAAKRSALWGAMIWAALNSAAEDRGGERYRAVARCHLVGVMLCVFVRESAAAGHPSCPDGTGGVADVQTATTGIGLLGTMGNKACAAIRFSLAGSTFCFLSTHLAAHRSKIARRNRDVQRVIERISFTPTAAIDPQGCPSSSSSSKAGKAGPPNGGVTSAAAAAAAAAAGGSSPSSLGAPPPTGSSMLRDVLSRDVQEAEQMVQDGSMTADEFRQMLVQKGSLSSGGRRSSSRLADDVDETEPIDSSVSYVESRDDDDDDDEGGDHTDATDAEETTETEAPSQTDDETSAGEDGDGSAHGGDDGDDGDELDGAAKATSDSRLRGSSVFDARGALRGLSIHAELGTDDSRAASAEAALDRAFGVFGGGGGGGEGGGGSASQKKNKATSRTGSAASASSTGGGSTAAPASTISVLDHDVVIWIGDLNYRIDESVSLHSCYAALQHGNISFLRDRDQLNIERHAGRVFEGFEEARIDFFPTYKYIPKTDEYDRREKKKKKPRPPAWCDRVLWRSSPLLSCRAYGRAELNLSDHKPVFARLTARTMLEVPAAPPAAEVALPPKLAVGLRVGSAPSTVASDTTARKRVTSLGKKAAAGTAADSNASRSGGGAVAGATTGGDASCPPSSALVCPIRRGIRRMSQAVSSGRERYARRAAQRKAAKERAAAANAAGAGATEMTGGQDSVPDAEEASAVDVEELSAVDAEEVSTAASTVALVEMEETEERKLQSEQEIVQEKEEEEEEEEEEEQWQHGTDPGTGELFWYRYDPVSGQYYYYDTATGGTTWDYPFEQEDDGTAADGKGEVEETGDAGLGERGQRGEHGRQLSL